mmetsp:Transcript_33202/g.78743  ORF Transcript_33202/g.78743 Transcript_33202/m.78743 type:complete len:298 (-) Transcript_33202:202-1095(-)
MALFQIFKKRLCLHSSLMLKRMYGRIWTHFLADLPFPTSSTNARSCIVAFRIVPIQLLSSVSIEPVDFSTKLCSCRPDRSLLATCGAHGDFPLPFFGIHIWVQTGRSAVRYVSLELSIFLMRHRVEKEPVHPDLKCVKTNHPCLQGAFSTRIRARWCFPLGSRRSLIDLSRQICFRSWIAHARSQRPPSSWTRMCCSGTMLLIGTSAPMDSSFWSGFHIFESSTPLETRAGLSGWNAIGQGRTLPQTFLERCKLIRCDLCRQGTTYWIAGRICRLTPSPQTHLLGRSPCSSHCLGAC